MAVSVTPASKLVSVNDLYIDESLTLYFNADVYGDFWHTLEIQRNGTTLVKTSPFELDIGVYESYSYTFTTEQQVALLTAMSKYKSIEISVVLRTYSEESADNLIGLPSIVRARLITSANASAPVITGFSYIDASAEVVNITGDNQVIIQGVSHIQISIEGAVALNGADIMGYRVSCKGKTVFSTSAIVDIGSVECFGNTTFFVTVVDSRGYSKTIQQAINIIEYQKPSIACTIYRHESNSVLVMADVSVSISSAGGYNSFVSLEKRDKSLKGDSRSDWTVFSSDSSFNGQLYYYTDSDSGEIEIRALDVFSASDLFSKKVYPTYPNVEIEKDYINVVGSLMLNGFGVMGYKGVVSSAFNNYTTSGFYEFNGTSQSNCPEETEGILEVIGTNQLVIQRLYCISGNTYWRICSNEVWTDWFN